MGPQDPPRIAKIWDLPTRLMHWALIVLIAFAWWTYKTDRMDWHRLAGYAVLALLAFRLFWGLFGSQTARFSGFVRGPAAIWRYLATGARDSVGHNPLGGWSVVLMLIVLVAQPFSGLFASDENGLESGPFADLVTLDRAQQAEWLHGLLFNVLLGLIALHVAAIVFYFLRRQNLVWPMLTGRGPVPAGARAVKPGSLFAASIGLIIAAAVFFFLWRYGG
jgi:cytochrome b